MKAEKFPPFLIKQAVIFEEKFVNDISLFNGNRQNKVRSNKRRTP